MSDWFLEPARLWLLLVVVALVVVYVIVQMTRPRYAVRFSNLELLDKVAPKRPAWRRHLAAGLFIVAMLVLVAAFAQPVRTVQVPRERSTIMLAIDTSRSMEANDVAPNRLAAAQESAKLFIEQLPEKLNVGLVSFAGSAQLLVPPTTSHEQITRAIDGLELADSTAIGDAVRLSLQVIEDQVPADGEKADAAIVLISDGETTVGLPTNDAITLAQQDKIPVSTIAYGTPDGTITVDEDGDGNGQVTRVAVNTEELARLADETGGQAYTAESATDLDAVYSKLKSTIGYDEEPKDVTFQFVGAGIVVMLVAAALSLRWFSRLP